MLTIYRLAILLPVQLSKLNVCVQPERKAVAWNKGAFCVIEQGLLKNDDPQSSTDHCGWQTQR